MNFKVLYLLNHVKLAIDIKTQEPRNKTKDKFVRSRMSDDRCKSILVMSNAVRHLLGAVRRICGVIVKSNGIFPLKTQPVGGICNPD